MRNGIGHKARSFRGSLFRYQHRASFPCALPRNHWLRGRDGGRFSSLRPSGLDPSWGHAEPEVVVPVARVVPVAVGRPAVVRVVVPTAAPVHAVRARMAAALNPPARTGESAMSGPVPARGPPARFHPARRAQPSLPLIVPVHEVSRGTHSSVATLTPPLCPKRTRCPRADTHFGTWSLPYSSRKRALLQAH